MTKRQWEHDGSMFSPSAAYNPFKRTMLSYNEGEDPTSSFPQLVNNFRDELTQVSDANIRPDSSFEEDDFLAADHIPDDYQIEEYPDDDEENGVHQNQHDERPLDAQAEEDDDDYDDDDDYEAQPSMFGRGCRRNQETGQFAALGVPGFAIDRKGREVVGGDGDELGAIDEAALDYLRGVRSERLALPTCFTAKAGVEDETSDDRLCSDDEYELTYCDGYTARIRKQQASAKVQLEITAEAAFSQEIQHRFLQQRRLMHSKPGHKATAALDAGHPTKYHPQNEESRMLWISLLQTSTPMPAQIRMFKARTVMSLLELLANHCIPADYLPRTTSAWIWGLLARLPSILEMSLEATTRLRDFAFRSVAALKLACSSSPVAIATMTASTVVSEDLIGDNRSAELQINTGLKGSPDRSEEQSAEAESGLALSKDRSTAVEPACDKALNTLATLDMIVIVVGEVFKQRDLLEHRHPWPSAKLTKLKT